jgi:hypothetical protein
MGHHPAAREHRRVPRNLREGATARFATAIAAAPPTSTARLLGCNGRQRASRASASAEPITSTGAIVSE